MADIERSAEAYWTGDLRSGRGTASAQSGAFRDLQYSFATRFEQSPGTNPEEMIAAAHASCFGMALSGVLARGGHTPERIHTRATVKMRKGPAGFTVVGVHLRTEVAAPGLDDATLQTAAADAKENCPISQLLKPGLEELTLDATLA